MPHGCRCSGVKGPVGGTRRVRWLPVPSAAASALRARCRHRVRRRRPPPSAPGGTRGTQIRELGTRGTQERGLWHTNPVRQHRRGPGAGIRRTGGTTSITGPATGSSL